MANLKVSSELVKAISNLMYPVGSIYFNTNQTNPSTFLGGTWARLTGGFIYGSTSTSGSSLSTGNGTGTKVTSHVLTINEMPKHHHTIHGRIDRHQGSGTIFREIYNTNETGGEDNNVITYDTGGGAGHNHGVPYIACSIWRRTA